MKVDQLEPLIVAEAKALLRRAERLKAKDPTGLAAARDAMRAALASGDGDALRRELPRLDGLVDHELAHQEPSILWDLVTSIGPALMVALLLRVFVVEAFKIPSSSMIPTLEIGDYLFVNKFVYGPRIPLTQRRVFELRSPARGEVIVFMYPCDGRDFIKRVIAVAGDTVEVRCNRVFVNGKAVEQVYSDQACSYFDTTEYPPSPHFCSPVSEGWVKCTCARYRERLGSYTYELNYNPERPDQDAERDPLGPYVEGDGDFPSLPVSSGAKAAVAHFQCRDERKDRGALGSYEVVSGAADAGACGQRYRYRVPPAHVFVMGDNRDRSNDSRSWGPVPIAAVKGKAMFMFWSRSKPSGVRLERFGSFVHQEL